MTPTSTIFKSDVKLTSDQLAELLRQVKGLHSSARESQGWDTDEAYTGWMLTRKEAWAEFESDFAHRAVAGAKYSSLYRHFNFSLNVPKRSVMVFHAKACNQLINPDPIATMIPEGTEDDSDGLTQADRLWRHRLKQGKCRGQLRRGVKDALVGGEGIHKISLRNLWSGKRVTKTKVWLDPEGNQITDSNGGFALEADELEENLIEYSGKQLKRDPDTKIPEGSKLSDESVEVIQEENEECLTLEPIHYSDFVCHANARSIHEAEYIAHTYDRKIDLFLRDFKLTKTKEGTHWLKDKIKQEDNREQSGATAPNTQTKETDRHPIGQSVLHIAEAWCRIDLNQSGDSQELCVVWDYVDDVIYYVGLMAKVSPTRERPIRVSRVIEVKNRWYGMGFFEYLSNEKDFIDRQINRVDARASASGRVNVVRADAFNEQAAGIPIVPGPNVYTLKSNFQGEIKDAIGFVELPEMDSNLWNLLTAAQQSAQLMTGAMTPQDAQASKMPTTGTLGELESIQQQADLLSDNATMDLQECITDILQDSVRAVFYDLKAKRDLNKGQLPNDVANLLGSEGAKTLNEWLDTINVERIFYTVDLTLSKASSPEEIARQTDAMRLIVGEATWVDICLTQPELAEPLQTLYSGVLTARKVQNVSKLLKGVKDAADKMRMQMALQQQQSLNGQQPTQPGGPAQAPV